MGVEGTQLMLRDVSLSGFSEQSGGHHLHPVPQSGASAGHGSSNFVTEL